METLNTWIEYAHNKTCANVYIGELRKFKPIAEQEALSTGEEAEEEEEEETAEDNEEDPSGMVNGVVYTAVSKGHEFLLSRPFIPTNKKLGVVFDLLKV